MITRFSSLYAGHVDLGDVGQDATPANERRYPNEHLMTVFPKTEAIAKCMDRLGFDTFWLAEHHFQHEGYECIPNILMVAVHLAHVTRVPADRLRLQHLLDVAPLAPRRGLCHHRRPHRRARDLRDRARLPHPRGRDPRRHHDGSGP